MKPKILISLFMLLMLAGPALAVDSNSDEPRKLINLSSGEFSQEEIQAIIKAEGDKVIAMFGNLVPDTDYAILNDVSLYDRYYETLESNLVYGKYCISLTFDDATLNAYDITKFDCVFFPVGQNELYRKTHGGTSLIDVIMQVLEADHTAIVWGHHILRGAYSANGDPRTRALFEEMGVQYLGAASLIRNQQRVAYTVYAPVTDSICDGKVLIGNIHAGIHSSDLVEPLRWEDDIDVFKLAEDAAGVPHERLTIRHDLNDEDYFRSEFMNDTISCASIRRSKGQFCFWSYAWGNLNGHYHHSFQLKDYIVNCMRWAYADKFLPEPVIKLSTNNIDFGEVPLGETSEKKPLVIKNIGEKPLHIESCFVDPWYTEEGTFESLEGAVEEGDDPVVLNTNEEHTVYFQFTPPADGDFEEELLVYTDAVNGKTQAVTLVGTGGEKQIQGPQLVMPDTIFCGSVMPGKFTLASIPLQNIGKVAVEITKYELIEDKNETFTFENYKVPISVPPFSVDTSRQIRFAPFEFIEFTGELEITSNSMENPIQRVYVVGTGSQSSAGPKISSLLESVEFENVVINETEKVDITLSNPGTATLEIESIVMQGADEFSLTDFDPEEGLNLEAGTNTKIGVEFAPTSVGEFTGKMIINSNAINTGALQIPLSGNAVISVEENAWTDDGLHMIQINPNPATANAVVEYTIGGASMANVCLFVTDMNGRYLFEIESNSLAGGTYTAPLEASRLSNGMYVLIMTVDGHRASLPFIVSK